MDEIILLKAKEASEILRVPLSTLYRLTKQGRIKGIKIGRQWRYKREDIMRYFNAGIGFDNITVEKRRYPRVNCRIKCGFKIFIPGEKDIQSQGIIRNISAGGVLVETGQKLPADIDIEDPVELQFTLELNDENMFVQSQARVVRIDRGNLGIKFKALNDEVKNRVLDYVGE